MDILEQEQLIQEQQKPAKKKYTVSNKVLENLKKSREKSAELTRFRKNIEVQYKQLKDSKEDVEHQRELEKYDVLLLKEELELLRTEKDRLQERYDKQTEFLNKLKEIQNKKIIIEDKPKKIQIDSYGWGIY